MRLMRVFVLLSVVPPLSIGSFVELEFLKNFFQEKNSGFTINCCWNKNRIKVLTQEMARVRHVGFFISHNDVDVMKKWDSNTFLVLDMRNCERSMWILQELNRTNVFVYAIKYLLLVDTADFSVFSKKLENYQILPNCEMILAVFNENSAVLYQPYKVGKINELIWENYGNWSLDDSLLENYPNVPTSQRRINLKRVNLVVGVVIFDNDSLNHLTDYKNPEIDTFTKQDFEPTLCLMQHMNIDYSLNVVDNYGYVDPETGLFGGLVRELQTGRADVSSSTLFFTEERFNAVDLLKQGNSHGIRFIVKKPSTSYIKNIYLITFNASVWVASIVILVMFGPVIIVILNWETKHKKKVKQHKYTLSDVTLIALEAVCQQGTATEPQSFAGRILALILFGAFMFIYVSYSANIVVLLQSTTKIENVEGLLESRIEAGGENIHFMRNYFEAVKKGPLRQLYLKKIYPDRYFAVQDGMKRVQEGNFAFHVSLQPAYVYILRHFTNYEICGLQQIMGFIEVEPHNEEQFFEDAAPHNTKKRVLRRPPTAEKLLRGKQKYSKEPKKDFLPTPDILSASEVSSLI